MLNLLQITVKRTIFASILTTWLTILGAPSASGQSLPEVWGTVGAIDDLISYGAGVKFGSNGIEVGTGEEGATGADFLTFVGFPVISPYLGLGYYSGDETIAYSGGAHLNLGSLLVIGGGYHSVRGPNGKLGLGLKF